jgi:hypothetical protein
MQGSPAEVRTPNTVETHRTQHDRHTTCVVAQQYSSTILASFSFYPRNEKCGARLNNIFFFLCFLKIA